MRLIILDRDGVINRDSDEYIKSPEEWVPIPGSLEAIAKLTHEGYRIVVATNQSGLARGLFDIDALMRIHEKMHRAVAEMGGAIDAVFFCPHGPDDNCRCRKPKPGLFEEIAARLRVDMVGVPAIGDSMRDIDAARAAGARPILVRSGKIEAVSSDKSLLKDVPVFEDLAEAVETLLAGSA
jgi:D-glycero-D-manno-heptose 1,7-bisphosphate phosphatase